MTLEVTGVINGIEEKHLVRKSDNKPFTLYKFDTQPLGEMSTAKHELREQGSVLLGAPVTIQYSEKPGNPGYPPNRYIEKITPAPQQPFPQHVHPNDLQQPTHVPPQGWEQAAKDIAAAQVSLPPGSGAVAQQAQQSLQNVSIGRDEAIWRQTATKTAASFNNADLAQYWERVQMLLDFYRTGIVPGVHVDAGDVPPVPLPDDDDIPF